MGLLEPRCTLPLQATLVGEDEVEEPIAPAGEVEMVRIIEVLSVRKPKHMKQIIIEHGLLRTHTQPRACSGLCVCPEQANPEQEAQRTPTELPTPTRNMWVGQPCARARA